MRILVVNWQDRFNPQAGGAELHLHEVFGRIARSGHEVDLLCSGFHGAAATATVDGIAVHRIGGRYTFPLHARRYYERRLRHRGYDVVVEDLNKVPLFVSRWPAPRVVVLVHHLFGETAFRETSPPVALLVWLLERPLGRAYAGLPFQAVSESTALDLVRRGIERSRIRVIYNGVDIERLTPDPSARATAPRFLYLGRLRRYKRVDVLIRALSLTPEPATLDIAGTGPDRSRLERVVRSLDIARRVRFLGFVSESDKLALLRGTWATLLASPREGWGISNMESAACGTPVIAADAPGVRESVLDGRTGLLVRPNTPESFANAMARLLGDPGMIERMGVAARSFAEEFSWDRAASETLSDLEALVSGKGRAQ